MCICIWACKPGQLVGCPNEDLVFWLISILNDFFPSGSWLLSLFASPVCGTNGKQICLHSTFDVCRGSWIKVCKVAVNGSHTDSLVLPSCHPTPRRLVLSPLQLGPRWWILSLSGFCLLCNLCAPWHSCLSRLHTPPDEEKCQQLSVHWPRAPQCRQCINLIKSPASGQIWKLCKFSLFRKHSRC